MGTAKRDPDSGRHLSEMLRYDTPASLKQALRYLRRLQVRAEMGCPSSQAIVVDLKSALGCYRTDRSAGRWLLTDRQREAVRLHLVEDRSVEDVGRLLGVDPSAVSHRINSGIRRMVEFLNAGTSKARNRDEGETYHV